MKLDSIGFEYVIDDFRGAATDIERALHCLFNNSLPDDSDLAAGRMLPYFKINVFVNNRFCWSNSCSLQVLSELVKTREGVFRPFDVVCGCPECEMEVSEIRSENDGVIIRWSMADPEQPGRLFEDMPKRDCDECEQENCSFRKPEKHLCYCFSAKEFWEEILKLARTVMAVYNIGESALGGPLTEEEQKKLIDAHGKEWGWNWDLEEDWSDYHWLREGAVKLLSTQPLLSKPPPDSAPIPKEALPLSSGDGDDDGNTEDRDAEIGVDPPPEAIIKTPPPVLYYAEGDPEPPPEDVPGDAAETFATLRAGMLAHTTVLIEYQSVCGDRSEREILPEILVRENGRWYCAGFCTVRWERRTFRLDRIVHCTPLNVHAAPSGIAAEVKRVGLFAGMN